MHYEGYVKFYNILFPLLSDIRADPITDVSHMDTDENVFMVSVCHNAFRNMSNLH